jgi:hypothetical protein
MTTIDITIREGVGLQHVTGVLALAPGRAAMRTLERVLAEPGLASDMLVIVGDSGRQREKRAGYRSIARTLGRVQRPALWVPGPVDGIFEREMRQAYGTAARPVVRAPHGVLFTHGAWTASLGPATDDIVGELMRTFEPRFAPRLERPAIYRVGERGRREWLEL